MLIAGINISKDNAQFIVRLLIGLFGNNHGIINASVNNLSPSTRPGTSQKRPTSGEQNCLKWKLLISERTPFPWAKKCRQDKGTSCHQNVSTDTDFPQVES